MKRTWWNGMVGSAGVGALVLIGLLAFYGVREIGDAVLRAGWGLAIVIAFHGIQTVLSALAWRTVARGGGSFATFFALRWIREAVNALLPVAKIGGEVVAARLMTIGGARLAEAAAGLTVDLTVEVVTQIAFTLAGLALLVGLSHDTTVIGWTASGLGTAGLAVAGFILAQRAGGLKLVEATFVKLADKWRWTSVGTVSGLHDAVQRLYRRPGRLLLAASCHSFSWALGAVEVALAAHYMGRSVTLAQAFIIESLGQAVKAVGFAVPGALGVQEGGLILVCGLFGITPVTAIALSLIKRLREIVLGVPGLLAWGWVELRRLALSRRAADAANQRRGSTSSLNPVGKWLQPKP